MNVKLSTVVESVTHVWRDKGITTFQAACEVITVARQLGYPKPLDTGIWPSDVSGLLRTVAARIRLGHQS